MLTVGVEPTFAIGWLIPRLASFRRLEPNIDVRITTGSAAAPFADAWTCGIKLGHGRFGELVGEPLLEADLVPVCAPPLKRPSDLKGATLLHVAHSLDDWPRWLAAADAARPASAGLRFEFYGQALQAAG